MFDKPKERTPKKCVHIVKRIYELSVNNPPRGAMYIVSHCLHKHCGQLSIRTVETNEKRNNG